MKRFTVILFAILLSTTLLFAGSALAKSGKAQLGVYLQELNDDLRDEFDYDGDGILITDIIDDSGADVAGLESGDIIIRFKGMDIDDIKSLKKIIKKSAPGDKIDVEIIREMNKQKIAVMLKEKKKDHSFHFEPRKWIHMSENDRPWIGIHMQDLNPQLAEYFKVKSGVLLTEVVEESPAEKAGLNAGDIVIAWDEKDVGDKDDLYKKFDKTEAGDQVEFTVVRDGKEMKKKITLAEREEDDSKSFEIFIEEDDSGDAVFRMHEFNVPIPHIPDFDFDIDMDEYDDAMDEYKDALDDMKDELEDLREELKELKEEQKN